MKSLSFLAILTVLTGLVTTQNVTHIVYVAANGFNFSPSQLNAAVGDTVEFQFFPSNHSVARSSFGPFPCIPYENSANKTGFFSGFHPVDLTINPPTWSVRINDTEPIFYYCGAPGSCFQGMIGVINPNATFTYEKQLSFALSTTIEFSPGEPYPAEDQLDPITRATTASGSFFTPTALSSSVLTTSTSSTTSAGSTSSTPSSSPTAAAASHQNHSSLSTGAIVGIVIAGLVIAGVVGVVFYMCGQQRTTIQFMRQQMGQTNASQQPPPNVSEAYYGNAPKPVGGGGDSSRLSGYTYNGGVGSPDGESYRSRSPAIDERTGGIAGNLNLSMPSPTSAGPGHTSPIYFDAEGREVPPANAGFRQYDPPVVLPRTNSRGPPYEMPSKNHLGVETREV